MSDLREEWLLADRRQHQRKLKLITIKVCRRASLNAQDVAEVAVEVAEDHTWCPSC